jgi:hypothetical protein
MTLIATIRKLARVALGLLAQMLTAAAGLGVIGRIFSNEPHRNAMLNNPLAAALIYAVAFGTFYALYLLLPMIAFVMVCEDRGYRDRRLYAGASAAVICFAATQAPLGAGYAAFVILAALIGAVSGLVYWRIAGRYAGKPGASPHVVTPAKSAVP